MGRNVTGLSTKGYFDEEDVQSYLNFLIERYHDEWIVIDDTQEGGDV